MSRALFDPQPATSNDLTYRLNEHSVALDKLIVEGGVAPGAPYVDGVLSGFDSVDILIVVPDHATQNVDVIIPFKCEVIDCSVKKITAAATAVANTFQLQSIGGAANITNAMSINNAARGDLVRATNIDDTGAAVILAGGTLRIVQTKAGGDASGRLRVTVVPRA